MEDVLTDVGLNGYYDGPIREILEKIVDEHLVLHETNAESVKEHDRATSMNRVPSFGYTDTVPE